MTDDSAPQFRASLRTVQPDVAQLETLVAIIEEGTFEAAARRLQLTPSAVSQRIRALEHAVGQVLVRRSTPCAATRAGEPLIRLGRQLRLLVDEATTALTAADVVELSVGVNADSLATWFGAVVSEVASWRSIALRLTITEEGQSHDLLRRGEILAAVTSDSQPVQGCACKALGRMRYTPAAAPTLMERHRGVDWDAIPMVVLSERYHLPGELLAPRGTSRSAVVHRVPTSADFHDALRRGLGWGLLPDLQLQPDLATGALVRLPGARPVDVPLYWHRWRLDSPVLGQLTDAAFRAGRTTLR